VRAAGAAGAAGKDAAAAAARASAGQRLVLRGKAGEELKGLTVWQEVSMDSPMRVHVVVEAEATEKEARGHFTLKLWDEGGQRTITLGNVMFP